MVTGLVKVNNWKNEKRKTYFSLPFILKLTLGVAFVFFSFVLFIWCISLLFFDLSLVCYYHSYFYYQVDEHMEMKRPNFAVSTYEQGPFKNRNVFTVNGAFYSIFRE